MRYLMNIVHNKKRCLPFIGLMKDVRMLSTGLHKAVESDESPILLPFHPTEKEHVIKQKDLLIPNINEIKETITVWSKMLTNRLESVDYAVLLTSGLHKTRLILSTVRMASSETPSSSAQKLSGSLTSSKDELHKKWSVIKEKLPAWQDDISHKLQRLQDYINKKLSDVNDKKECK